MSVRHDESRQRRADRQEGFHTASAGQSHSRQAVWSAALISTGHLTADATYDRCASETGRSTSDDRVSIRSDRSRACRQAEVDPLRPSPMATSQSRSGHSTFDMRGSIRLVGVRTFDWEELTVIVRHSARISLTQSCGSSSSLLTTTRASLRTAERKARMNSARLLVASAIGGIVLMKKLPM